MTKIKIACKHCHKHFLVDWHNLIRERTAETFRSLIDRIFRKTPVPSHEMTLDLKCPHCGRKAPYQRSEGEEV